MHSRLVEAGGGGLCVRRLGASRAGEIRLTRFLRNEAVTVAEMVRTAAERTASACAGRHVLAIQDTTVVQSDGGGGTYLHPVLAIDAQDGAILGLIHACFLERTDGKKQERRAKAVEDKESFRWIEGASRASQVCAAAQRLTVIADRESDIFEAFAQKPAGVDLVIRAAQDRSLKDGGRLFAFADALPEAGRVRLNLPARPGRPAREALLAVRFAKTELRRPRNGARNGAPASVDVTLVDIREIGAPANQPSIHWRLLATQEAGGLAQALDIVELYRRRWSIEQLFRTLKTQGFDIEALRIGEPAPRRKLTMAALIAAVAVQQLVHARDSSDGSTPLRPATDAFKTSDLPLLEAFCADLEGKTERQKNPHPRGSLAYAAWVCARLGGWTGYYGKPGPIVMLKGWLRIQDAKHTAAILARRPDV